MLEAGRYRLTRRLGQGGMAEVFEAVAEGEAGFRRRVAIKKVLPQLVGDAAVARMFLDEARIASQLHHAGIVAVLDFGTIDGSAFQALEFVDGLDLEQILRRAAERKKPLPLGLSLHITVQVALALDYAHAACDEHGAPLGIVHRDVSPSNVLISWDGQVKLSDFGIALAAGRLERTVAGGIKGKLEYMAPEQVSRGQIDRRADVFALGCMLHKLVSGQSPLQDLNVLTGFAFGAELPLDREIEPRILAVIEQATRVAKTQRYASTGELSHALRPLLLEHLSGEPTLALRDFLAGLRNDEAATKRGMLDALLDVELVLAAPDSDVGRARTFSLRTPLPQAPAPAARPDPAASTQAFPLTAPSPADPAAPTTAAEDAPAHGRRSALLIALSALLLAAGASLWTRTATAPPGSRKVPATTPRATPESVASVIGNAALGAVSARSHDAGAPRPTPVAPQPPEPTPRASRRREPRHAAEQVSSSERGTLVIGGDGALRAQIEIDGRAVGYAPKRLELATGSHEVVLIQPGGARLGPRRLEITAHNTESAPARWIVTR